MEIGTLKMSQKERDRLKILGVRKGQALLFTQAEAEAIRAENDAHGGKQSKPQISSLA